jgi:hypothetical protein
MDVSVERLLQIIGEEVVKVRLLEEQLELAEASLGESPLVTGGEPNGD